VGSAPRVTFLVPSTVLTITVGREHSHQRSRGATLFAQGSLPFPLVVSGQPSTVGRRSMAVLPGVRRCSSGRRVPHQHWLLPPRAPAVEAVKWQSDPSVGPSIQSVPPSVTDLHPIVPPWLRMAPAYFAQEGLRRLVAGQPDHAMSAAILSHPPPQPRGLCREGGRGSRQRIGRPGDRLLHGPGVDAQHGANHPSRPGRTQAKPPNRVGLGPWGSSPNGGGVSIKTPLGLHQGFTCRSRPAGGDGQTLLSSTWAGG